METLLESVLRDPLSRLANVLNMRNNDLKFKALIIQFKRIMLKLN
jgi:hypothetical protein